MASDSIVNGAFRLGVVSGRVRALLCKLSSPNVPPLMVAASTGNSADSGDMGNDIVDSDRCAVTGGDVKSRVGSDARIGDGWAADSGIIDGAGGDSGMVDSEMVDGEGEVNGSREINS